MFDALRGDTFAKRHHRHPRRAANSGKDEIVNRELGGRHAVERDRPICINDDRGAERWEERRGGLDVRKRMKVCSRKPDAVFRTARDEIGDDVGPITRGKYEYVIVASSDEHVATCTTIENVVAVLAKDRVASEAAIDVVVSGATAEGVVAV